MPRLRPSPTKLKEEEEVEEEEVWKKRRTWREKRALWKKIRKKRKKWQNWRKRRKKRTEEIPSQKIWRKLLRTTLRRKFRRRRFHRRRRRRRVSVLRWTSASSAPAERSWSPASHGAPRVVRCALGAPSCFQILSYIFWRYFCLPVIIYFVETNILYFEEKIYPFISALQLQFYHQTQVIPSYSSKFSFGPRSSHPMLGRRRRQDLRSGAGRSFKTQKAHPADRGAAGGEPHVEFPDPSNFAPKRYPSVPWIKND